MKIIDAISAILQREGVEFLSTYPTTPLIDAAAKEFIAKNSPWPARQETCDQPSVSGSIDKPATQSAKE